MRNIVFLLLFGMTLLGCGIFLAGVPVQAEESGKELLMATTTSTDNTGLLEYLMPAFTEKTGIGIRWISTGTGKALKLGENCDVDVLLVHAPEAEIDFVNKGFGIDRRLIMYNDFVLIGPPEDPAGIKGRNVSEALQVIRSSGNVFVSRGDNSGTHKKEQSLWKSADVTIPEKEPWYRQSGQGMLATINVAAELNGYTLTDRGTYIKYESVAKNNPDLAVLVEGDPDLLNQYSIIPVNPAHCPSVKYDQAQIFAAWLASGQVQKQIGEFKLLGKPLFTPNAGKE
ncbi:MAG: tungsten ABC transporter substrate-binding protein [Desulfobacterales bacterium SG8_35_2]|nr:MAG: tungsten ABC transporter substrate-binding protein [Desulfobacterales bacterium SG8_35_2]